MVPTGLTVRAPGRVNLMGDHTDYNDGFVLPAAVDRECRASARERGDGAVHAWTITEHGETVADVSPIVSALTRLGCPPVAADVRITTTIPLGSGLSSSAAFEVATAVALCQLSGFHPPPLQLALACRDAEEVMHGVPCGPMDQMASVFGVAGHALLIDCRSHAILPIALPSNITILVVHSGESRSLVDTPYATRRAHCEEVARDLGVRSLRDATFDQVSADPIARHVVTENARVAVAALALAAGDLPTMGRVMAESHASLSDDFGCSTPALDDLVVRLVEAGAAGARLTGAGWGGCAVALVTAANLNAVVDAMSDTEHWVCNTVDGAGVIAS